MCDLIHWLAETRQTTLSTSSATIRALRLSMATPTVIACEQHLARAAGTQRREYLVHTDSSAACHRMLVIADCAPPPERAN